MARTGEGPATTRSPWIVVASAVVVPAAAAALMVPLRSHTQASNLALVMVVVVAAAVAPGHRVAALVAGLSAGIWFDFFLTRPYEHLTIQRSGDAQTTILLVVVAVVVGEIAARRRRAARRGRVARDEVVGLYVVAQMLSAGARPDAVIDAVTEQLQALLALEACRFEPGAPDRAAGPSLNRAGELDYGSIAWSTERDGLPPTDVGLPVVHAGDAVGRFVLRGPDHGTGLNEDRLLVAVALADLVGAALHAGPDRALGSV